MQRVWLVFLLFVLALGVVPARDASAALLGEFTIRDEQELGRKIDLLIKSRMPLIEDPEITGYLQDLVGRLTAVMPPQPFPIRPYIIQNSALNAFAMPGGSVFVHTGLILNLRHESELAGVLAHELAHVSQRHIAGRIEKMQMISLAAMAGVLAGVFLGGGSTKEAMATGSVAAAEQAMLKYSQDDEREADQVGMNYLVQGGFNPEGLVGGFEAIRRNKWLEGSAVPSYLSTHPALEERMGDLDVRIGRLPAEVRSRKEADARFLRIQTLLRARYADPETTLTYYEQQGSGQPCLDLLGKAIVYDRLNRTGEAEASFGQALQCAGDDPLAHREAGRFFFRRGDFSRAGVELQKAVIRNPTDLLALFYYARLMGEQGHPKQAADYYERILRRLPEDAEVHYYYGRILGEDKRYFDAHLHLAYSALYGNDRAQLRFHLEKARELAKSEEEKKRFEELEKAHKERAEFW